MVAGLLIPLSLWWFFSLREPGFKRVAAQGKTPFWSDMKHTFGNRNFILLTLTIFTLAMGFNFVNLLGSYIPIFYVFGGDKVAGAYLLGINGTVWAVTGLLAVFPLNWISPKIGKKKTLMIAIALMVVAQLSKIVCYNPTYPYLIIIPTLLLSAGMLFFFTLGSSMVGDICDEDDLQTGHRTEGSFYSIFWWFIKMGTALASFVAGSLIVLTQFDQTQVTKVDALEGSIREMRVEWQDIEENGGNSVDFFSLVDKARTRASELEVHLEERALKKRINEEHLTELLKKIENLDSRLKGIKPDESNEVLDQKLKEVEELVVPLKRQSPFTLLMMRVVEIGIPILLSIFSIFFITRYALTEKRSHEIKELLQIRNRKRDIAESNQ
jgi:GPH family glycoside/pentoside/hexuronide:cation symporter